MTDTVSYAITRIKRAIPKALLDEAFLPQRYEPGRKTRMYGNVLAQSIDDQIKTKIIDGFLAVDLDNFAGVEDTLPLHLADRISYDTWNVTYRFDSRLIGNRTINKVHEVLYGMQSGYGAGNYGPLSPQGNKMSHVMRDISRAAFGAPTTGTAYVELIGPNTILINDSNALSSFAYVRCTLSFDDTFSEIKPVYRNSFAEVAVAAAKAFVYNTLVIDVDEGVIRSGKTMGRFREILDSYSDSLQVYDDLMDTKMRKIMILNDTEEYRKVMKLALGAKPKF